MSQYRKDTAGTVAATAVLGDIRLAQDDLPAARQNYQQALAIHRQVGNKGGIAESQAALAGVSIEEGKYPDAEATLRNSLAEFHAEKVLMDEIRAETDLSRVLLSEGKLADARQAISDALALSANSRDPSLKLPAAIQDARIEAAELASRSKSRPDLSDPRRKLQNVLSTAHQLGYYGIECDARLALAELDLRTAPAAARSQLALLAQQAHDRGLNLVSKKAAQLFKLSSSSSQQAPVH